MDVIIKLFIVEMDMNVQMNVRINVRIIGNKGIDNF